MTHHIAPPVSDHLPIALRASAKPTYREWKEPTTGKPRRKTSKKPASPWVVIFDTETTSDHAQSLRFGTFQVRHHGERHQEGIFYDPEGVNADELLTLRAHANDRDLDLVTRDEFVDQIFYGIGYRFRAMIVGFNLPFDIARIALRHESARLDMRGGFSFTLSEQKIQPNVRVRHLSQSAAIIKFAAQFRQIDSQTDRNRKRPTPTNAGHFLDIKTLAKALFARSFTLASLGEHLKIAHPKLDFDAFDAPITDDMIGYAVRDVQATWECYANLVERFAQLKLGGTRPEDILSEASIGKAYLRGMGIQSWQNIQPDFPPQLLANIMGSYFGGRSEVRIRCEVRQVILCDFLSMYPTVCTLMNLWPFVRGEDMTWQDTTADTQTLLDAIGTATLQSPDLWRRLTTLVRVVPNADIFPVRAGYGGGLASTIGSNYLSGEIPLWFTLADCIASKLLTGKAPKVVEAMTFSPGPIQTGLAGIDISGNAAYHVDPNTADFFKRVIELRQETKDRRDAATGVGREALDTEQNALKIAANATSYGIYVEVNVEDTPTKRQTTVHASTCDPFSFRTDKNEKPGPYFSPLLATLICGAARLMLAITERLVSDQNLEWSFCDTDSMAIAKPADLDATSFTSRVDSIVDWFGKLNPYDFTGSILQVEKVNAALDGSGPKPLYCWAVSAKRYALFNIGADRTPALRKISAHGLGHLLAPFNVDNPTPGCPVADKSVLKDGVEYWQHDFWWQIINAALNGNPGEIDTGFHPAMLEPAMSRYGATTPELLGWFKTFNASRDYRERVKPFNFLLAMMGDGFQTGEIMVHPGARVVRVKPQKVRPIAPYGRDLVKAAAQAFDRETGKPVSKDKLLTYADALAQYHIHPEAKFLNGRFGDRGTTLRRHIHFTAIRHIGKEAQDWERQAYVGLDPEAIPTYGVAAPDRESLTASLRTLIKAIGMAKAIKAVATNQTRLQRYLAGRALKSDAAFEQHVMSRLPAARAIADKASFERQKDLQAIRETIARDGHNATARRMRMDPSNLRRSLGRTTVSY